MPVSARVWVYQADRNFSESEKELIEKNTRQFIDGCAAHQQPLKGSSKVFYNRFLVIAVDESYNMASGCSIDASVHFLKELEQTIHVNLFNRSQVAFLQENNILTEEVKNLKQKIAEGLIKENTLIFNNLVANVGEFQQKWQQPAKESWMSRFFS